MNALHTPAQDQASGTAPPVAPGESRARRGPLRALWSWVVGGVGVVMGIAPHVLHHVGFLIGAAVIAGTAGTVLFGALGLLASVPLLLRLRRRFGTWRAPAIALGIFVVMFTVSTLVIGPAISGRSPFGAPGAGASPPGPVPAAPPASASWPAPSPSDPGHASHHQP